MASQSQTITKRQGGNWDERGSEYINLIDEAIDVNSVLELVDAFLDDLTQQGKLPQLPVVGRGISIRSMEDAYRWLGLLISRIQEHVCILSPDGLLAIHATFGTAFSRFRALGIR